MLGFDAIGTTAIGESSPPSSNASVRDSDVSSSVAQTSLSIDAIVADLTSGAESQRRTALHRIINGEFHHRTALAEALFEKLIMHSPQASNPASSKSLNYDLSAPARSWLRSALIWCEPENQRTMNIAKAGVTTSTEPVAFVRFWTLAAVIGVKATYLHEIATIAATDPFSDVAFLSRSALSPDSTELITDMRAAFNDQNLGEINGILRALRIIPVPAIVQDVAALLRSEHWAHIPPYDVFCALATPPMATAAADILSSNPGLDIVVGKMVKAAETIDSTTAQNFAHLLAKMDWNRSELLLREREALAELRTGARMLLNGLLAISRHNVETFRQLPGFTPDTIDGQADYLDIQAEVNTLTAIMMAKDVTPPLAIGLFGEWGAGKSLFMSIMKTTVKDLITSTAQAGGGPFCANAVQIHFNAWHYADANLWASLVSSIFEDLDGHLRKKDAKVEERDALLVQLAAARAATEAARVEEAQASERLREEQARLAAAAAERENNVNALSRLQAKDVADLLMSDKELKAKTEKALRELGLPIVMDGIGDLRHALTEAQNLSRRALAMFMALSRDPAGLFWFAFFIGFMALSPALIFLIHRYLSPGSFTAATISTIFTEVVAFITSAAALLRRGTTLFTRILAPLEDAKRKADAKLAEKRQSLFVEENQLREKVGELRRQEEIARTKLDTAVQQTTDAEERLKELDESRTLAHFIAERRASADYRKHLSLVSVVRQDFELLVDRIKRNNEDESSAHKLDRIILYIDDLDRCPSDKVVDVLQAVHLLLAYPLFVVVVGVDARWLLNSLTLHYKELGIAAADAWSRGKEDQIVSPQHYLEKIFQIPYVLRPMNRQGYGRLISQLMGNGTPTAPIRQTTSVAPLVEASSVQDEDNGLPPVSHSTTIVASALPSPPLHTNEPVLPLEDEWRLDRNKDDPLRVIAERALIIQPWEVDFAQRLYDLIPSPRSAKRLINVYRVLKAGVDSSRLAQFEGSHDAPGEFQLPLLLLAILICDPREANLWFTELLEQSRKVGVNTLDTILRQGQSGTRSPRARLIDVVASIVDTSNFPQDPTLLIYWVPRVARFSFHAWHGVIQD
jgi:hypothetical protein